MGNGSGTNQLRKMQWWSGRLPTKPKTGETFKLQDANNVTLQPFLGHHLDILPDCDPVLLLPHCLVSTILPPPFTSVLRLGPSLALTWTPGTEKIPCSGQNKVAIGQKCGNFGNIWDLQPFYPGNSIHPLLLVAFCAQHWLPRARRGKKRVEHLLSVSLGTPFHLQGALMQSTPYLHIAMLYVSVLWMMKYYLPRPNKSNWATIIKGFLSPAE